MAQNVKTDITRSVISSGNMRKELTNIFTDSIILDNLANVVSISRRISEFLGYNDMALSGTSVYQLLAVKNDESLLAEKLQTGYFEEWPVQIKTSSNRGVMYSVSGFHLGLISDIDDLVVLKLKNLEEMRLVYDRLEAKEHEMDDFVYHSAHSLRGPLATLKGLINLSLISNDKSEVDMLTYQMSIFAQQLDDKLSRLINYSETGKESEAASSKISLSSLGQRLKAFVDREPATPHFQFEEQFHDEEAIIEKGDIVFGVLLNIVSCCLQQKRSEASKLSLKSEINGSFLVFEIKTHGVILNQVQREKFESVNFGYVNVLNEPESSNLYAAKKSVLKLDGSLRFAFPNPNESIVHILIPNILG